MKVFIKTSNNGKIILLFLRLLRLNQFQLTLPITVTFRGRLQNYKLKRDE